MGRGFRGNPRQAAGHYGVRLAVPDGENSQDHVASGQSRVGARRRGGERNPLLRHVSFRVRFDSGDQLFASGGIHRRRKLRLVAETGRGRFDHQLIEMLQHVLAGFLLAAPPSGHRRHAQIFAQELAAKAGQERQVARRFHQPAAESVVNHHGAVADGLRQGRARPTRNLRAVRGDRRKLSSKRRMIKSTGSRPARVFK